MPASDLLVPEGTRLVHIGPHKTGTSALQAALHEARPALEAAGVVRLGKNAHESMAVSHVVGRGGLGTPAMRAERWAAIVAQANAAGDRRAVLSSENFAESDDAAIGRVADDLGPRTHIVVTLRPLAKILPSQWQQFLLRRLDVPYEKWLEIVLSSPSADDPRAHSFWQRHRHDELVARWAKQFGADNVTVVALDPRDRQMLGSAFEGMLGLPEGALVVDRAGSTGENRSFTLAEAEMVRAFNALARTDGNTDLLRVRGLTHRGFGAQLRSRTPDPREARFTTPAWALERAGEIGAEMAANLRASGVRIVGDLAHITSTSGETGDPKGETWLPPEVGARFAVAVHHAYGVATKPVKPATAETATNALAGIPTRSLARELLRRAGRRAQRPFAG